MSCSWFTYRTSSSRLSKLLNQLGGCASTEACVDVFMTPYRNSEIVQGRLTNMAGRQLIRFLHDKSAWGNLTTPLGLLVAPRMVKVNSKLDARVKTEKGQKEETSFSIRCCAAAISFWF